MLNTVNRWIGQFFGGVEWLIQTMDVTQWAIVSVIFVVLGFMALRSQR